MHPALTSAALKRLARECAWPALALAAGLVAIRAAFSQTHIFYLRDLSTFFWPQHLWLREMVLSGRLPLWEPHSAFGYPIHADPTLQLFLLPTLPLRFLLPDALGFNLWIALPIPLAALTMYAFARRRASRPASALAAIAFATSGPALAATNMMNQSWTLAALPVLFWALDRLAHERTVRRVAVLAGAFACVVLAAEPVHIVGSGVTAVAYALVFAAPDAARWRERIRLAGLTVAAAAVGLLASAVQVLPILDTTRRSVRGAGLLTDTWSLHPTRLLEAVSPDLFGSPLDARAAYSPWIGALNDGREPWLLSIYVGVTTVALALVAVCAAADSKTGRRWALFWGVVLVATLVLALGYTTPLYPALRTAIPPLRGFRYPIKYALQTTFALCVLAAAGWDVIAERSSRRGVAIAGWAVATVALAAAATGAAAVLAPGLIRAPLEWLAALAGVGDFGAGYLAGTLAPAGMRLAALAGGTCCCIWLASSPRLARERTAAIAPFALVFIVALDLQSVTPRLAPTLDASLFREPAWVAATRAHPDDRVFVTHVLLPGYSSTGEGSGDDLPPRLFIDPASRPAELYARYWSTLPVFSAPWHLREAVSMEVTGLRPVEYLTMTRLFVDADREAKYRFLNRAGVRYFLVPTEPPVPSQKIAELPDLEPMALYEGPAPAPRAALVPHAASVPNVTTQMAALFNASFDPTTTVLLESAPPESVFDPRAPGRAEIVADEPSAVTIRANAPGGGYVLLRDAYDPDWRAKVDDVDAPVLRADGLFRAVWIGPGEHTVRFVYEPRPLLVGAAVSLFVLLALGAAVSLGGRRARRPPALQP